MKIHHPIKKSRKRVKRTLPIQKESISLLVFKFTIKIVVSKYYIENYI